MKCFDLSRSARGVMVVALLAGCGGPKPPIGVDGVFPQRPTIAPHVGRGGSWIAPEAKSEDLLYISDVYGVHIFSYPKGIHVGDITGFASPAGLCSNKKGDVFVTDTNTYHVYEYAHGSTKRLETLYDLYVDFNPINCSVDLTTGNLAVSSVDSGFVVVFPKAEEKPKVYYEDVRNVDMLYCAYDNKGDLFVDKVTNKRNNYIGELPKGATRFANYLLNRRITHSGGIEFDGKHVAIEDQGSRIVYALRFAGTKAIVARSTPLNGTMWVQQYWIQGKTLIGPDENSTVYFWTFPGGGSPLRSIQGFTEPYGSTVSVSP